MALVPTAPPSPSCSPSVANPEPHVESIVGHPASTCSDRGRCPRHRSQYRRRDQAAAGATGRSSRPGRAPVSSPSSQVGVPATIVARKPAAGPVKPATCRGAAAAAADR